MRRLPELDFTKPNHTAGWSARTRLALVGDSSAFEAELLLAPGHYAYKYIIDGRWMTCPSAPSADDGTGNCASADPDRASRQL